MQLKMARFLSLSFFLSSEVFPFSQKGMFYGFEILHVTKIFHWKRKIGGCRKKELFQTVMVVSPFMYNLCRVFILSLYAELPTLITSLLLTIVINPAVTDLLLTSLN